MSLGRNEIKQIAVYVVASDPGVNDDIRDGFTVGSTVFSQASNTLFKCTDNTAGAAVWTSVEQNVDLLLSGDVTTTSDTASDITGFTFPVAANSIYRADFAMRVGCSGAGGLRFGFNLPASTTVGITILGRGNASTAQQFFGSSQTVQILFATVIGNEAVSTGAVRITVVVTTGATSGTFALQYASQTAGQTSTIFKDSSFGIYKKVG